MSHEASGSADDRLFSTFYTEVKRIEKNDSVLTSEQQINRLLRPGASYLNLNPYEVLIVDTNATPEEIKKQYRKLSILIHPDKNPNDRERAQEAFDIVNRAQKTLESEEAVKKIKEIIEEAKARFDLAVKEKKKRLKKEGSNAAIEEDDPEKYKRLLYVATVKLFAEKAKKRKDLEDRDASERKRTREAEIEAETNAKMQKEWVKNFEESRDERTTSWKSFQDKKKKAKPGQVGGIKPPKLKPEQRLGDSK